MDYLPIFLDLKGRAALIVGGDERAARKVELLLDAGAAVRVVAEMPCTGLAGRIATGTVAFRCGAFDPRDLDGVALVIAACSPAVEAAVAAAATARGIPVNVVDAPRLCSFIMPAIVDRSPIIVALSSGGTAPALCRRLRAQLENLLPSRIGGLARLAGAFRGEVRRRLPRARRRRFWDGVFDGRVGRLALAGRLAAARGALEDALLVAAHGAPAGEGCVVMIALETLAPDAVPLGALRALQEADVLVHDLEIPPVILALARRDAERVPIDAAFPDDLVTRARAKRMIVRLKHLEPFALASEDPEWLALCAAGIPCRLLRGAPAELDDEASRPAIGALDRYAPPHPLSSL